MRRIRKRGPSYVAKRGNVEVPVYTIKPGRENEHFVVCYYEASERKRRYFSHFERAKSEAGLIAAKINEGELEVLQLTGADRHNYLAATNHLRPLGIPLVSAVKEYTTAISSLNGSPLLEAVRFYIDHHRERFTPRKVPEIVTELLEIKANKGRSEVYTKDLRYRLNRFALHFKDSNLHELESAKIENWLYQLKLSPRSINNFLGAIRTLFTFGTSRRYVPKGHPGVSEVEEATEPAGEVAIFTPAEMGRLLSVSRPEMIPFLALGAFGGIRSAEIQRLSWSDVKWDRGVIEIKSGKAKTRARRLVPLNDCLRAWLLLHCRKTGPVVPFANVVNQIKWLTEATDSDLKKESPLASFAWKTNALRHSFISYRLAQTNDENLVAQESGNSPAVIFRHYRAVVAQSDAELWFSIKPDADPNVIPISQAVGS